MKRIFRPLIQAAVSLDPIWSFPGVKNLPGTRLARERVEVKRLSARFATNRVIDTGPFTGMRYPWMLSSGSVLIPKLVGTYESELTPAIEQAIERGVDQVIDIGCAEGYFAVGLARRLPDARIFAYDIDDRSRQLCHELAEANRVGNVEIHAACTAETIIRLPNSAHRLIISDCEGYEIDLFTTPVCQFLAGDTIIVELHDMKREGCKALLNSRLQQSHHVTFVQSETTAIKASRVAHPILREANTFTREAAVSENRGQPMEWLIARPRT
ncbi:methyltransferase domain-containing protein [Nibricoccus sp. IMCC34717]|uniref:methyltransferase domain-containing protein n=1 Tax=Nibricoccus sp. IMCC34717 TaxID=3034021 RepID=UPI00384AD2AF